MAEQTPCEAVMTELCDRACDCTAGDRCRITRSGATVSFDMPGECDAFFVDGRCSSGDEPDVEGCEADLEGAECVAGTDEDALALPAACE